MCQRGGIFLFPKYAPEPGSRYPRHFLKDLVKTVTPFPFFLKLHPFFENEAAKLNIPCAPSVILGILVGKKKVVNRRLVLATFLESLSDQI